MANIKQGILGGFSGKVGTPIGSSPRISGISRIFLVHELARIDTNGIKLTFLVFVWVI